MKAFSIISFAFLIILSCNKNEVEPEDSSVIIDDEVNVTNDIEKLNYIVRSKNDPDDLIRSQEYTFDEQGKVISEKYTNFNSPQHNHTSFFTYNENGKVIEETRDGETFKKIIWTEDSIAKILNRNEEIIEEFIFEDDKLIEYRKGLQNNNLSVRKLNHDSNQNVISIGDEDKVISEFLDYDIDHQNPLYLIKSIGILRIDYKPFFKNIHNVEMVHPFYGDDFESPLKYYNYYYVFDSDNRVEKIDSDRSIYTQEFSYE